MTGIYREIGENLDYSDHDIGTHAETIQKIKDRIRADDPKTVAPVRLRRSKPSLRPTPNYRPMIAITDSSRFYDAVAASAPGVEAKSLIAISAYY